MRTMTFILAVVLAGAFARTAARGMCFASRRFGCAIRRAPTVPARQFPARWGRPVRLVGMILPSDAYRNFLSCAREMRRVRIAAISRAHRKKTYSMSNFRLTL